MFKSKVLAGLLLLGVATAAQAETLTNDLVLALLKAGLGDEVVIAKIKSSSAHFDLSTNDVIGLKDRGVSGAVIAAMITSSSVPTVVAMSQDSPDPTVPHPSGVYYFNAQASPNRMQRLDSTTTTQVKTSGLLGYALTSGLAGLSLKGVINGATASLQVSEPSPTFFFFFDQANQGFSASGGTITSPKELNLIALQTKKDRRETKVGSIGLGGSKVGLDDKGRIATNVSTVSPGVYKVTIASALPPGEYGFASSPVGSGTNASFRVFDFSVR